MLTTASKMSQADVIDMIGFPPNANLCYQAAMLQAIFSDSAFTTWLHSHHQPPFTFKSYKLEASGCQGRNCAECCRVRACIVCALKRTLQAYQGRHSQNKRQLLRRLMDDFSELLHNPYIIGGEEFQDITEELGQQQDAVFLLECLANRIDRQTNLLQSSLAPIFGRQDCLETKICSNPTCNQRNRLQAEGNFWLILHPNQGVRNRDQFCDVPLTSLVDLEWNIEIRDITCDSQTCWARQDRLYGPLKSVVSTEPSVLRSMLCIQLLRYNYYSNEWHKNAWPVTIPGQLDLTDYAHSVSAGPRVYNLVAVVAHEGHYGGGHYKAIVKRAGKHWFEANDDHIQYLACRTAQDRQFEKANGYPPAAEAAWSSENFFLTLCSTQLRTRRTQVRQLGLRCETCVVCCILLGIIGSDDSEPYYVNDIRLSQGFARSDQSI